MSSSASTGTSSTENPLLTQQTQYLSSLPSHVKGSYFSEDHVDSEERAQIWSEQAELGEALVNQYSWATPDERSLKIIKHFAGEARNSKSCGLVEIGCGSNAYWSRLIAACGVDVLAFDSQLHGGGKINNNDDNDDNDNNDEKTSTLSHDDEVNGTKKKKRKIDQGDKKCFNDGFTIYKGGPEALNSEVAEKRILFLCYPDEDVYAGEGGNIEDEGSGGADDAREQMSTSLGAACLEHFKGDTIIHVGELVGDTISMDQAPWGRSSGAEFQQRLYAEYHCILKAKLMNWLHVQDSISVWKRSKTCSIVFQGEGDDDHDEEVEYKHIPEDEKLPCDIAAPCAQHLL